MRKDFYDSLEVDSPDLREGGLFGRLPNLIALALSGAGWARQLNGVDPNSVTSREALALCRCCAPTTGRRCAEDDPPFGGFALSRRGRTRRVLMSPGPVFHPDVEGKRLVGRGARPVRGRHASRRRRAQLLLLSSQPVRVHDGLRRACARLHRHRGRSGRRHAAADVMRALGPRGLCRLARFPQAPARCAGGASGTATVKRALVAGRRSPAELRPRVRRGGHRRAGVPDASRRRHHRL